jgi:hypothetical protein
MMCAIHALLVSSPMTLICPFVLAAHRELIKALMDALPVFLVVSGNTWTWLLKPIVSYVPLANIRMLLEVLPVWIAPQALRSRR